MKKEMIQLGEMLNQAKDHADELRRVLQQFEQADRIATSWSKRCFEAITRGPQPARRLYLSSTSIQYRHE